MKMNMMIKMMVMMMMMIMMMMMMTMTIVSVEQHPGWFYNVAGSMSMKPLTTTFYNIL